MQKRSILEYVVAGIIGILLIVLALDRSIPSANLVRGVQANGAPTATTAPPPPGQDAGMALDAQAHAILASMSLDDKLGQLIVANALDRSLNSDLTTMLDRDHIGGYFIDSGNMTAAQLRAFTAQIQARSRIPLIIPTDFEGGAWNPISVAVGQRPSPAAIGTTGDPAKARQKGVDDARILASVGINVNFAPVVDVLTNPTNPILQGRTFGATPDIVVTMATAYIDGLTSGGIAGTLKHFPGLGAATVDPHKALPTVNRTLPEMEQTELVPYRDLLATNHAPMIMTTHMLIPALDPNLPTSISPLVITRLLRQQMGYNGVVISDALYMGGLSNKYSIPQAGLLAFEAGTDLLLGAENSDQSKQTIQMLKDALLWGEITQAQIDTSVLRVLRFKLQWKIIPANFRIASSAAPFALSSPDAPITSPPSSLYARVSTSEVTVGA